MAKLESSEASLGFSSLRVVLIFHLNTCEVLRPRSIAMLDWEGDTAQELERAVKHPNLDGDPARGVQGNKKRFSSRWTRGIPREEWDYSLFSCCLLISLLISPFLFFHLHLHLQPHIHLHALWAAHSLCPHSSLPSWSSFQHQWLCPSHRQVLPTHLSLDFDSWYPLASAHPTHKSFMDFRPPLWGMRIWKRINLPIDYSFKKSRYTGGHRGTFSGLEET